MTGPGVLRLAEIPGGVVGKSSLHCCYLGISFLLLGPHWGLGSFQAYFLCIPWS
jgi:hypothetical protein